MQSQGGLSGAVRAQQCHALTAIDPQIHSVQGLAPIGIGIGESPDGQQRGHADHHATTVMPNAAVSTTAAASHCRAVAGGAVWTASGRAPA